MLESADVIGFRLLSRVVIDRRQKGEGYYDPLDQIVEPLAACLRLIGRSGVGFAVRRK